MKFSLVWIFCITVAVFIMRYFIMSQQKQHLSFYYSFILDPNSSPPIEVEQRELKDKTIINRIYLFSFILIVWQGVWNPTHQFQIDSSESVKQHNAYVREYNIGWDDQCGAIFSRIASRSEVIYGKTLNLSYEACADLKPSNAAEDAFIKYIGGFIRGSSEFEKGVEGNQQANSDALDSIFLLSDYWCWGNECVTIKNFDLTK